MGNICSGCQRDKEDQRHTETYRYDKNIPISLYIEKQRVHYTDTVKNRLSKHTMDTLGDSNAEKPIRIEKNHGLQEFWKKNQKGMKGFNPTIRPSATYQIDNNLAIRFMNNNSDRFDSAYYDDTYKKNQAATKIQKWYLREKQSRINSSNALYSFNNSQIINKTQASYSMNTIDLSIRQS